MIISKNKESNNTYNNYQILPGKNFSGTDIMPLFKECFRHDGYYKEHTLPNISFDTWCENLVEVFDYCLNYGFSYVLIEDDEIIGFLLAFDYFDCKENNYAMFEEIFKDVTTNTIPYMDLLHNKITKTENPTIFLLLIAIDVDRRRNKLASRMIDEMISDNTGCNIAGDVDNVSSLGMYENRGFTIQEIDTNYFLIERNK